MKEAYFFQREWAETVRLYSGLLEAEDRINFIKKISKIDILLAAECRATSVLMEEELDDFLSKIALSEARQFKSSSSSAKGIMALVELSKFDEITQIFTSIKHGSNSKLHYEVVANYIANGNELQISTFLLVLAESNKTLLERAIDKVFDQKIYFTDYSMKQLKDLIHKFLEQNEILIAAKLICVVDLKVNSRDAQNLIETLLEDTQLKYVEKLVSIYGISPTIDTFHYLSVFLKKNMPRDLIIKYLNLCKQSKARYNLALIRVELSKHLNPRIKSLSFDFEPQISLSQEVIYKIYLENIKLANVSSISYALSIVEKFGLQGRISIDFIVENLLITPKTKRLELAYKLVKANNLSKKYPYQLLLDLAINCACYESYNLAREIIINEFDDKFVIDKLMHLCCIILYEQNAFKLAREILRDIQTFGDINKLNESTNYFGIVLNYSKNTYQIDIGIQGLTINIPLQKVGKLKLNEFVLFRFANLKEKLSDSEINIINKNIIQKLYKRYYFEELYIGQVLKMRVIKYDNRCIYLNHLKLQEFNFIININEISNTFVKQISDFVSLDQIVNAKLIDFDISSRIIYCSLKSLGNLYKIEEIYIPPNELDEKVKLLKNKFRKG